MKMSIHTWSEAPTGYGHDQATQIGQFKIHWQLNAAHDDKQTYKYDDNVESA